MKVHIEDVRKHGFNDENYYAYPLASKQTIYTLCTTKMVNGCHVTLSFQTTVPNSEDYEIEYWNIKSVDIYGDKLRVNMDFRVTNNYEMFDDIVYFIESCTSAVKSNEANDC